MSVDITRPPFELRTLTRSDASRYRVFRLEGLRSHPAAFGASLEEESVRPEAWFADRLEQNIVFGGYPADSSALSGAAGFTVLRTAKQSHKGVLWGMFVRPAARGMGLGLSLLQRVLEHAATSVEEVRLTVGASNTAAIRLYNRVGFQAYGMEPRALKVGDHYHDELLMALSLRRPS